MKTLALVESPDHVCCRYRLKAFEPAVRAAGGALIYRRLGSGVERWKSLYQARGHHSVILQRKLLSGLELNLLRRRSEHLIFDFDDAVLFRDSNDPRGPFCQRRARRFRQTMRLADLIVAGNDFLADCASRAGAPAHRILVVPTCVDLADYPVVQGHRGAEPADSVRLVWIGSSSTLQGLELQADLWRRIGREVPGARLRVVCDRFPDFHPLPIEEVRWSAATEAQSLATADIGISWIPDDLWSQGKCGLKLLQYQAAGLPVITNPVGVHGEIVEHGKSGYLVNSPEEWLEATIKLFSDPELRRQMGESARESVARRYSTAAWAPTVAQAFLNRPPAAQKRMEPRSISNSPESGPHRRPLANRRNLSDPSLPNVADDLRSTIGTRIRRNTP